MDGRSPGVFADTVARHRSDGEVMSIVVPAFAVAFLFLVYKRWIVAHHRSTPVVGTNAHFLDWMTGHDLRHLQEIDDRVASADSWQVTTVEDLDAVQELLDWLEAAGYAERELVIVGYSTFVVRWR